MIGPESRSRSAGDARRVAQVRPGPWRTPQLDASAADALAVVTLYASSEPSHAELARHLLDELTQGPEGAAPVVGGLVSVCSALLVLLEYEAGIDSASALDRIGRLLARAGP